MKSKPRKSRVRGFALVVTLSLMILLTVIAVGLLSLSSISLRSSSHSSEMATARSNARMALLLALGELQKAAGPDTRVTARADLVDENHPPVLGVWKSWEGTDHENSGRPIAPNYSNHKQARFVAWLTSASREAGLGDLPDTAASATDKVTLLGEKTVGVKEPAKRQIHLTPTRISVNKSQGRFAWWVSGENQKARLPRPYAPASDTAANWSVLAKTHGTYDTAPFGLDQLLTDESLKDPSLSSPASRAISLGQSDLLKTGPSSSDKLSRESYHDLSTESVGLLTNTATGGWRKDLSLASESWSSLNSGLAFFRVKPERDIIYRSTNGSATPATSLLYPWSAYRTPAGSDNRAIYSFPAIGSWSNLVNYATMYKTMNKTSGVVSVGAAAVPINGDVGNFIHKVRVLPLIARVQWIYSHLSTDSATAGKFDLKLRVQPVITLWNPYNVSLSTGNMGTVAFRLGGSLPPVIDYAIGGAALPKKITYQKDIIAPSTTARNVTWATDGPEEYKLSSSVTFAPGEAKVFSPRAESNELVPGYIAGGGKSYTIAPALGVAGGAGKITTGVTFDSEFLDPTTGVGLYLNMTADKMGTVLAYRMLYERSVANVFYPPMDKSKFPQPSLAEVKNTPTPFLSVTFGARMASNTHLPSKGFVQSSPFVNYTAMGAKAQAEADIAYPYPGVFHNVNSPFEYSFQGLIPGNSSYPDVDPKNRGFIVTGFKVSDGLSRCVIDELPARPLGSLAELQNWDARYENPVPPYSFNLVGNSDATPLIPAASVVNSSASAKGAVNLQHDDSYCLNHVLFDDWFLSTIAPEPVDFGGAASSSNSKSVYTNFLREAKNPLANRAYKALPKDVSTVARDPAAAGTLAVQNVGVPATSWKTIASRLEVEGMFNVNSTSVKAWRALLGHARNQKVPYMGATGSPSLSSEQDYPQTRFSVAGDVESKKSGNSGTFVENAEYAGYRVFTGSQLDFLAEEIVKQVRLRGPFLSLAEFVNRQLSTNDDLALAGAIQTALNKLSQSNQNPFDVLQKPSSNGVSKVATATPPGGTSGYSYSAAANGYRIYGIPGWTRQADVLRPIAPILSARDDTFTIRAYGDARDASGKVVRARAVCEATIRRSREYVDPTDDAALGSLSNASGTVTVKKPVNDLFGRRFEMVSFRWLSADEI
ncbi:MAG: hypothetical protein V4584_04540 [Verrucomicrobiota bacterium]